MRIIVMRTIHAPEYECPKCQNHDLKIELWDDDWTTAAEPIPDPLEDGHCPTKLGGCGFKGYRMDFDPTGIMKAQWEATGSA